MAPPGRADIEYMCDKRVPCKYGTKCYQKNPAHHCHFKHPTKQNSQDKEIRTTGSINPAKKLKLDSPENKTPPRKGQLQDYASEGETSSSSFNITKESDASKDKKNVVRTEKLDARTFIKSKFLVEMPQDFYSFWDYCKALSQNNPCNAFAYVGLILVGPYDVLAGKFENAEEKQPHEYLLHWRYYHDPPEFQTVLKAHDSTGYHIGYFRDKPTEMPNFLGSNCAKKDGVINVMGENIFAAVSAYLEDFKKTGDPFKKMHISKLQASLKSKAEELKIDLTPKTAKIIEREKNIVARSFNRAGIVVPFNKKTQLGYRELALSNKELKKLFGQLATAGPVQKSKILTELQPVFTYASIAADECDFGTGLELGLDILYYDIDCLNTTGLNFLSSSYRLLNREPFAVIAEAHMKHRKKGCDLSII